MVCPISGSFLSGMFAMFVCVTVAPAPSSSLRQRRFHREVNPSNGPGRLSPVWNTTSRTACGHRCISQHGSRCRNFLYNSATGRCTPGSAVVASQPPPNSTEGELYRGVFPCDTSKGFSLRTFNRIQTCVSKFDNPKLNYSDADARCRGLGAFLMSVKTLDKLAFLHTFVQGSDEIWVGCDDREQEDVFVWKEDGSLLTPTMRTELFDAGEPRGQEAIEDCIGIGKDKLRDFYCTNEKSYMCEQPLS